MYLKPSPRIVLFTSVLVGIGVEVTFEVIAAASLLRKHCPELRVRVVNVTDLMILQTVGAHPHALSDDEFYGLFTTDRPIYFNYHGYPQELKGLLFGRKGLDDRVQVGGYVEEGTTTSPFDVSGAFAAIDSDTLELTLMCGERCR